MRWKIRIGYGDRGIKRSHDQKSPKISNYLSFFDRLHDGSARGAEIQNLSESLFISGAILNF